MGGVIRIRECPFCGGEAWVEGGYVAEYGGRSHQDVWVECRNCGAKGPEVEDTDPDKEGSSYGAVVKWNERAIDHRYTITAKGRAMLEGE